MRSKDRWITLLRSGNRLVIEPTMKEIQQLLVPELSYIEKKFFRGKELSQRRKVGLSPVEEILWECYGEDHKGRLATSFGFAPRIRHVLRDAGYKIKTEWGSAVEAAQVAERLKTVYLPRWDRIDRYVADGFKFRYRQREALETILNNENGRFAMPPAYGKGTLIVLACIALPKAKIAVVTKNVAVLHQRLYPELALNLPSVGLVGGGKKILGRRVMCYTADSLHHAAGDEDIVFVDEGHQACADVYAERMAKFEHARVFMFSATWDMRLDNKDMRAEAMAGPVRMTVTVQEAEAEKIVAPVRVHLSDVIMDINPCGDIKDQVEKKRYAYWANDYRNRLIRRDARRYGDDVQVLITVDTVEHALHLKQLLPEFEIVYSGMAVKPRQLREFRDAGLLPDGWKIMTNERKAKLTRRFEKGRLRKVIVTTVWNVGVNFKRLAVLIRGDGGGSPTNDTQIPGRTMRLDDGKEYAIVHDYLDQFDTGCKKRAGRRVLNYDGNGWDLVHPDRSKRSLLRQMMEWGEEDA